MKRTARVLSVIVTICFITFLLSSSIFAAPSQQTQASLLEKTFKAELSKILNPDSPLSCDIITTSTGQKSIGYGLSLIVNQTKNYKVAFDRKNRKFFVQTKKDNTNQIVFLNGQNIYTLDPKDNKYVLSTIPTTLWMSINMLDSSISQSMSKFYQTILNYLNSQLSSIVKSAYKTTTSVGSKKISCWQLSATLPSKVLEPAFKEFLSTSSKSVLSQLSIMLDVYLKSLTDDEKKALSSLNIDVSKLSSAEISKQLESNLSKFISSIKLDDYKISFYVDEKTGKIVKIIIKNVPATSGGVSSRIEMTNILTGNDVKFLQISQNMIKQQFSQIDIVGLLKLIENFVAKMQQIK
ncbi:hypothetical protein Calkr_2243 [Caldicellulosiruptor acetigenus I77R1B]|uniref:DUF2092 domain-containing protein n=1 Tax=Caldicellulosiruptor acetigenus (strain ATCC 700853 / DSM 12137 / I77R1B) TaxID=632335 RepID=E4S6E7_CALA7|nr:hypothetical protein [Caldicellulosiruptor acetigenus]ADQ41705.1 hypothetical protein Calkr_2243 [Caldicellulosiruptor acetigenus I77R1B]